VLDLQRDQAGVLSYTVAVRSLDGAGPRPRGVAVSPAIAAPSGDGWARCTLPLTNTGQAVVGPPARQQSPSADVYRIAAAAPGWTTWLPATVTTANVGETVPVDVYVKRGETAEDDVTVTVASESDPTKSATASCRVV
jgi:hypothetical protein